MTPTGEVWKTVQLYDPAVPLSWEDLSELYDSDGLDGEPGFPRPIEDFELEDSDEN